MTAPDFSWCSSRPLFALLRSGHYDAATASLSLRRAAVTAARDAAPLRCCAQPPIVWPQPSGASEMHTPPSPIGPKDRISYHRRGTLAQAQPHIRLFHGAPLSCKNLPSHNSRTFSAPLQVMLSTPLLPYRGKKRHALPHTGRRAQAHPRVLFRHLRTPHPFVRGVLGLALAAAIVH